MARSGDIVLKIKSYFEDSTPEVWTPRKTLPTHRARMEWFLFRIGAGEFFQDCYKVEVLDDCVVIHYYLKNRKGKRYYNRVRGEAASSAIVFYGVDIPDWLRQ